MQHTGSINREIRKEQKMKQKEGFTLIEVIVAIAVVAVLAGVITPSVIKYMDDSKSARAKNDCLVIGSAIGNFYKDTGRMPNMNSSGTAGITLLVSQGDTPSMASGIRTWNAATTAGTCDLLGNHLTTNTPKAQSNRIYPTTGELAWRGAYQTEFPADPWGNRYAVNIGNAINNTNSSLSYAVWVLSAGPNGTVETEFNPNAPATGRSLATAGDDIAYRIK
jgi:prepilin-type N-terminal cleavage/methylation domain-containing protein